MSAACVARGPAVLAGLALASYLAACDDSGPRTLGIVLGSSHYDATLLALDDELARGPIPGLDTITINARGNRAAPAIEHASRVVSVPGIVAVVGHSNSAASLAAARIYNDAGVVQLAPSSTAEIYSEAGPFSFRMVPPDPLQGRFLADAIAGALPDGGDLAVFYVNDDYGRGLHASLLSALDTTRHRPVLDLPHAEPGDPQESIAHIRSAVRAVPPDLVVWLGRASTLALHLPPLREELGDVPVLGGDAVGTWPLFPVDGSFEGWRGVRFVDFVDLEGDGPELREVRARYAERFGRQASGPDLLAYDAVRLILAALRDGATTGEEVRAWMASLGRDRPPFRGVTGEVAFTPSGDVSRSYQLLTIRP